MNARTRAPHPKIGMTCAFTRTASERLADIPGTVIDVWPRLRSGDYLVTLEYARPVKLDREFIRHIDALLSELDCALAERPVERNDG